MKICRGDKHPHVGFTLDFSEPGAVLIDMRDYVAQMINDFPEEVKGTIKTPAAEGLFDINPSSKPLNQKRKEAFHSSIAQGLFLAKRGRPDVLTAITFLCTRVTKPTEEDWRKLKRVIQWLSCTKEDVLRLKSDGKPVLHWYGDASFAVHPDFKSHTGGVLTMGHGCVAAYSMKHKINTRSSTEAELIAVDDLMSDILWSKQFMEAQGLEVEVVVHQDNQSTMRLMTNGRQSIGKRSRHLNIRFFFVKNIYDRKLISIVYCPTDDMLGDYFTKPVQGKKFIYLNDKVMGRRHHKEKYDEANIAMHRGPICAMTLIDPDFFKREDTQITTFDTNGNGNCTFHRVIKWHACEPFDNESMNHARHRTIIPVKFLLQDADRLARMWYISNAALTNEMSITHIEEHFVGDPYTQHECALDPRRPVVFGWVDDCFGPIQPPQPVTKAMSLQEALATLSDDLYYKIWKLYLSLETVDAEEQCKQDILNRMRAEATVRFPHEGSNTSHLFLLDAAMYVRYPYGLVLTNVTMPIGNCIVCFALGNNGYRCRSCDSDVGVYGTLCFTDFIPEDNESDPWRRRHMLRPWDLSISFHRPNFEIFTDVEDFLKPERRMDEWNLVHNITLPELIQSCVNLGFPSSREDWGYFWDAVPYHYTRIRDEYFLATGEDLPPFYY